MSKLLTVLAFIMLLTIAGCSNTAGSNEQKDNQIETQTTSFTGTIKKINGHRAIVSAVFNEGNPESDVVVDLSVNQDETFQIGDVINVEYDGVVMESDPAQIATLAVEHAE